MHLPLCFFLAQLVYSKVHGEEKKSEEIKTPAALVFYCQTNKCQLVAFSRTLHMFLCIYFHSTNIDFKLLSPPVQSFFMIFLYLAALPQHEVGKTNLQIGNSYCSFSNQIPVCQNGRTPSRQGAWTCYINPLSRDYSRQQTWGETYGGWILSDGMQMRSVLNYLMHEKTQSIIIKRIHRWTWSAYWSTEREQECKCWTTEISRAQSHCITASRPALRSRRLDIIIGLC